MNVLCQKVAYYLDITIKINQSFFDLMNKDIFGKNFSRPTLPRSPTSPYPTLSDEIGCNENMHKTVCRIRTSSRPIFGYTFFSLSLF